MLTQYKQLAQLSETLYGGVFLCQVDTSTVDASAEASTSARLAVLKLVDLRCAMAMLNAPLSSSSGGRGLDDPRQEKAVANLLRRTGGHRNVVQYLDDVIVDGVLYFVMEFCSGGDLHEHVNRQPQQQVDDNVSVAPRGRVAPLEALAMAHDIASGLAFLHAHDVAHRDLSLENILIGQEGTCKLADFGLSTCATRRCNDRVGKAYYMAPEVAASAVEYDPKQADMWSFGIVLFVLLTGSPLVSSATQEDKAFCSFERVGLIGVLDAWGVHHIPRAMRELLNGLLQVDPRARYTIEQVLAHEAFAMLQKDECPHEVDTLVHESSQLTCHQQEESQSQMQRCPSAVDTGFTSNLIET